MSNEGRRGKTRRERFSDVAKMFSIKL